MPAFVKIKVEGLRRTRSRLNARIKMVPRKQAIIVNKSGEIIKTFAKREARRKLKPEGARHYINKLGKTRPRIIANRVESTVFCAHHAARYLEFGTAPHPIIASFGKPLVFIKEGRKLFFPPGKGVMHPGHKAFKIFERATRQARSLIRKIFKETALDIVYLRK